MPTLTIVPLSTPSSISMAAYNAVCGAKTLFLQTDAHPSSKWIKDKHLPYISMDDLYDASEDFDKLNQGIASRVICGSDAIYAVPGRSPGEAQIKSIRDEAALHGTDVVLLPGAGYADAAAALLPFSIAGGAVICAANQLPWRIDPLMPLCIEEIDTRIAASEVKLALAEYYPDDYKLWFFEMNDSGNYSARRLPIFELDRQPGYFAATCCILPAADPRTLSRSDTDCLMEICRILRAPGGCPWDREQTHFSIRSNLIEEAYEVIDAIDKEDPYALCEELGDLMLQVALHTVMAEETSDFTLRDVTTGIVNKLIYRHPHVFGSVNANTSDEVLYNWEKLKKREKHMETYSDIMDAVPKGFPALMRSAKIQKKAAHAGFDWSSAKEALYKLPEEVQELSEAIEEGNDSHIDEELGDVFFAAVNVCRLLKRDPEDMLNAATNKFMARFKSMEQMILADSLKLEDMTLAQMDEYWDKAKAKMLKN